LNNGQVNTKCGPRVPDRRLIYKRENVAQGNNSQLFSDVCVSADFFQPGLCVSGNSDSSRHTRSL